MHPTKGSAQGWLETNLLCIETWIWNNQPPLHVDVLRTARVIAESKDDRDRYLMADPIYVAQLSRDKPAKPS